MKWFPYHVGILLMSISLASKTTMGVSFYRRIEGFLGRKLLNLANRQFLKQAELIKKEVFLPEMGLTVHYYERTGSSSTNDDDKDPPTLLLFHGMTDEAKNFGPLAAQLATKLPHWRIVIPDLIGHGHDLERVRQQGGDFDYPTPSRLLQSIKEFLRVLQLQDCVAFGISLGGALAYFLHQQQPTIVRCSILISPALDAVLDPKFITDYQTRKRNAFCYENRNDIRQFFQDLSSVKRTTQDPIPTFFLQAIWQDRLQREPPGHFRTFFDTLLEARGNDPDWLSSNQDLHPTAKRLVIWPQEDHIANHDQGQAFFANSHSSTTTFYSLADCGHLFHADGKTVMQHATPGMIEFLKQHEKERVVSTMA